MPNDFDAGELDDLMLLLLEGSISKEQFARLQTIIQQDPDAMWYYIKRVDLSGSIGWGLSSEVELEEPCEVPNLLDLLDELPPLDQAPVVPKVERRRKSRRGRQLQRAFDRVAEATQTMTLRMLAVAATFGILLIAASSLYQAIAIKEMAENNAEEERSTSRMVASERAAQLVDTSNCTWGQTQQALQVGNWLRTGQAVDLEQGVAEFLFENGARVILQAPSSLRIDSSGQATLFVGTLTASVPEEAIGFSIESEHLKLIDLGTEFGMVVTPSGAVQADVFDGQVSVTTRAEPEAGWSEPTLLRRDEVLSVDSAGTVARDPIVEPQYVHSIPGSPKRIAIRNPSFEQPVLSPLNEKDSDGQYLNHGQPMAWRVTKRSSAHSQNGCLRPPNGEFTDELPNGKQVGYTNRGETLFQVLDEVCSDSTEYRLVAWAGVRRLEGQQLDDSKVAIGSAQLVAGETVIAETDPAELASLKPGEWKRVEVHYTVPDNSRFVGQPLAIRLVADAKSDYQINYDALELVKVDVRP
ncbi:hypothetical protein [Aeoliella sp.]|uniref:hypothetical protein n=1 Tax=Aeoliella sp. TaxID=2795800 RepID=UPI003CCBDBEB